MENGTHYVLLSRTWIERGLLRALGKRNKG
jgi:hypothetical protein